MQTIVRTRPEHNVSRRDIDADALKVMYRLRRYGFRACLVGGGVRDLLLGRRPKDFDVGTDAHPNQIRKLFKNCVLIGRRFRLAHIRFRDKIIETSTFRRQPDPAEPAQPGMPGYPHRDNTFGTPEEDARRRDFTINGLFYDIADFSVIDHVGGLADLDARVVRCIGDPDVRFVEDPVRMIRAVRFAARLGFGIEPATLAAIRAHAGGIVAAAPPRLLEEVYRLFGFGTAEAAVRLLWETGLVPHLFAELDAYLREEHEDEPALWRQLRAVDNGAGADADPAVMRMAALYYGLFAERVRRLRSAGREPVHADVARELLEPAAERFRMPRHLLFRLVHVFDDQRRFFSRNRRFSKSRLAGRPWFGESLGVREMALAANGGDLRSLEEWKRLHAERPAAPPAQGVRRPRRRRGSRRRHAQAQGA